MGADATLVGMAYRAAMAKVPGDWSKAFELQYSGIKAANAAMTTGLAEAFSGAVGEISESYAKRREKQRS